MLSSNGKLNPGNLVKIIWRILQSAIAIVLLICGGLQVLRTASIVTALPFTVMVFMAFSIFKALEEEEKEECEKSAD